MSYKLFIPGPIAVSEKTLRAMAQPMIGHRSTDFVALYNSIQPELQALAAAAGVALQQRPQEVAPAQWVELAAGLNQRLGIDVPSPA